MGRTATAALKEVSNPVTGVLTDASVMMHSECLMSVQDTSAHGPTVIYTGPALLVGELPAHVQGTSRIIDAAGRIVASRSRKSILIRKVVAGSASCPAHQKGQRISKNPKFESSLGFH